MSIRFCKNLMAALALRTTRIGLAAVTLLLAVLGSMAAVQRTQAAPIYNIVTLGLGGVEHTRDDGDTSSSANVLNEAGQVMGVSSRYNGGHIALGRSVWLFDGANQLNIGLTGVEHTRNDGFKESSSQHLNEAGQVAGSSDRFNGGSVFLGRSAWRFNGTTTVDIGLIGVEHTRSDGYKQSSAQQLNEGGQVRGSSFRYNGGGISLGNTAWLFDGTITLDIGLTGVEHTSSDGAKTNHTRELNEAGHVIGYAFRHNGGPSDLGRSAWLFNGATTLNIGLTDAAHTRVNGFRHSEAQLLNESGHVSGNSERYSPSGRSAWFYNGVTTMNIGLTDVEHTRNDGAKLSNSHLLNQAGHVLGSSFRFNGSGSDMGDSAWLYNGASTLNIGLTGAEHTRNDGYKDSSGQELNEAGQVAGASYRYHGGSVNLGRTAWLYDGATTVDIGLVDAEHTFSDDSKVSYVEEMNEAGQVRGRSWRFNGSGHHGETVWLFDGANTRRLGLTDAQHTRADDTKYSATHHLNEAGQVAGDSTRYNGAASVGQTAWLYDPALDQTYSLALSARSDGYAYSSPSYLGEDGLVLGDYTLFDAFDNDLGRRAFAFTIADGLHDLGSLVSGGLAANGWDRLASSIRANGFGQILGHGLLSSQVEGARAYLMTPVPEPSASVLGVLAALGSIGLRQRRRCARESRS